MKIAYLTYRDAKDKREWSGTLYYMAQSLSKHAGDVVYIGPFYPKFLIFFLKVFRKFSEIVLRKKYNIAYNYLLSLVYKYHFTKKINKIKPDVVFAASASPEMSLLKLNIPIIYLGDITFNLLKYNYPNFMNLLKISEWESELLESKTFKNASALVFSSEWATNSAENDYKISKNKIHLISYGANMDTIPRREEVISKSIQSKIKIVFLGVDWIRKGGSDVYNTFIELVNRGINVELTVCGCIPPIANPHQNMKVIPFLNKNKTEDFQVLYNILMETHFLFVPSKSDCTPIVFCEANAFGIPVITSDVGGITSVIKNGINGHTFPLSTTTIEYANTIQDYYNHPDKYQHLVNSSREYYESNLNWDKWGKRMNAIIINLINNK
jgi:glycosyltransferase involved in cell wall biosynthesis